MSQKDLGLKVAMRKHLWRLGYSTRINVPLRAYTPQSTKAQSKYEEFTDLDVLGVAVGRDVRVEAVIGDCKTTEKGSTERMFWLRGVADYFDTDTAYLVRQNAVTRAARQLASRLQISIILGSDFKALEEYHQNDPRHDWKQLDALLSAENVQREDANQASLSGKLTDLADYLKNDFWAYEQYRNLFQGVAHLEDAAHHLEATNPAHLAIVLDCAWHFALTISHAVAYIRRVHISEIDATLKEYVFGGQLGLREKINLFRVIEKVAPSNTAALEILPPYYGALLELVTRFLRRPDSINSTLRYAEILRASLFTKYPLSLEAIFGNTFDAIAAKLLTDLVNFLCNAAALDVRLRNRLREVISPPQHLLERIGGDNATAVVSPESSGVSGPAIIPLRNSTSNSIASSTSGRMSELSLDSSTGAETDVVDAAPGISSRNVSEDDERNREQRTSPAHVELELEYSEATRDRGTDLKSSRDEKNVVAENSNDRNQSEGSEHV